MNPLLTPHLTHPHHYTYTYSGSGGSAATVESDLLVKVKKLLNVYVVQGSGVGELMFSGCCRKGMMEEKVLVTVVTDHHNATFRFNCEVGVGLSSSFHIITFYHSVLSIYSRFIIPFYQYIISIFIRLSWFLSVSVLHTYYPYYI